MASRGVGWLGGRKVKRRGTDARLIRGGERRRRESRGDEGRDLRRRGRERGTEGERGRVGGRDRAAALCAGRRGRKEEGDGRRKRRGRKEDGTATTNVGRQKERKSGRRGTIVVVCLTG